MSKQLKMFKRRVQEKDEELKKYVEMKLRDNQKMKDEIVQSKENLSEMIEENVADDLRIFELRRELGMKEMAKDVELQIAKEMARIVGGEEEAAKVDEDYDVKQSRLKA